MKRYPEKLSNIEISTTVGCKLDCKYCPQRLLLRRYAKLPDAHVRQLSFKDYVGCVAKVHERGTITFSGMAEVFQNDKAARMMRYAFESGRKVQLFTTLVGANEKDLDEIKDIRFSTVVLHLPDEQGNSKFCITKKYLDLLIQFIKAFDILYYSCHGSVHSDVINLIKKETPVMSVMNNRSGNLEDSSLKSYSWKGKITCVGGIPNTEGIATGFTPVLLPNGVLTACCNDYGLELVIGNLVTDDWETIINGPMYNKLEHAFDNDTIQILCRQCNRACDRHEAILHGSHYIGNHAVKVGKVLQMLTPTGSKSDLVFDSLKGRIKNDSLNNMRRLVSATNVCVFGLGKLFMDNYFETPWHNVIQANIFSDNRSELWGKRIGGILCVNPENLHEYKDLLIVIYIKNDKNVRNQLDRLGLKNYFNIDNLLNAFD